MITLSKNIIPIARKIYPAGAELLSARIPTTTKIIPKPIISNNPVVTLIKLTIEVR